MDESGKKIKYWTCVMHPSVKMPQPGNCPVCKMELIPIYEGAGLTLTEKQKALIPIRTEAVGFRKLAYEIRTVGVLDYNETRVAYASTRISGWIERLHVDFTGINVREGDELLSIYSPELLAAQEEYLASLKSLNEMQNTHLVALQQTVRQTLDAAKSKLELFGLTPEQIDEIREHGEARTELPLYAPIGGTVIHMNVYKGQHVNRGMNLYRIADLKSLWIMADVYEYELPFLYMGQEVEITAPSMPNRTFHGKVTYIYPYFDAPTRTQKVQIEVPNVERQLRPGMYVALRLKPTLAEIHAREAHPKDPYACPMHPWITAEYADACAICGMDLEPTRPIAEGEVKNVWTCPMHPEVQQDMPGECEICGMDLIEKPMAVDHTGHDHGGLLKLELKPFRAGVTQEIWTCPMHPQVQQGAPGECEICGMDLIEKEVPVGAAADEHAGHAPSSSPMTVDTLVPGHPPLIFKYACRDHPEEYATAPGRCPKDGKGLVMTGEVLAVPKRAVIDTGLRKIVFADRGESGYEQLEVELGPEAWAEVTTPDGKMTKRRYYPIVSGVNPDEMVVTNGNFLLDSQTQLTGSAAGAYGGALGGAEGASAPAHRH
jgi:biotin carboxyl carrier protein